MKNGIKLVISLLLPLAAGGVAGLFTQPEIAAWYKTLQKPVWQPPNWLFGPVWTILYLMMGIALYLVWKRVAPPRQKRTAITLWAVQLGLNFFWSFLFFKQHQIGLALADIIALWIGILLTAFAFAPINRVAAWLLVPYIGWVSFAGILNFTIYRLNG